MWLNDLINNFFDWFMKRKYGIDKPKDTINIDYKEVIEILQDQLKNDNHILTVVVSDYKYKLAPKSEYMRMIRYDNTNTMMYDKEYLDCDDFATRLHGAFCIPGWSALVVGEVICNTGTDCHAINCFIDSDKKVWLCEPQNDQIWGVKDKDWQYFSVELS